MITLDISLKNTRLTSFVEINTWGNRYRGVKHSCALYGTFLAFFCTVQHKKIFMDVYYNQPFFLIYLTLTKDLVGLSKRVYTNWSIVQVWAWSSKNSSSYGAKCLTTRFLPQSFNIITPIAKTFLFADNSPI
jgi:hypothetical protein